MGRWHWRMVGLSLAWALVVAAAPGPPAAVPHASKAATAADGVAASAGAQPPGRWLVVGIGLIGGASEDILSSAFIQVHEPGFAGLILRLDTPGGSLESTRKMVQQILGADVPVVVWVGPAGARAGSAGAFITLAAHVAAMAPGTNIGASHPVDGSGKNVEADAGSEMARKVTNDTLAFMESIARERHRNIELARSFVETSVSITDLEALKKGAIDLRATDVDDLLRQLDGRVVTLAGGVTRTLATKGATHLDPAHTLRQQLLEFLANPNILYLLFMAGLIGLGYELTHPGIVFPGVAGTICLLLALISMSVLPVSYGAVALILAAVVMMVAEAFVPSYGVLGIGGVIAFVLGSAFLVDPAGTDGLRVSWYLIAPGAAVVAVAFIGLGFLVLRSRRTPVRSGVDAMIGAPALALAAFKGATGQVRVGGEIWSARLAAPGVEVNPGDQLVVKAVRGLELEVTKP